MHGSSSLSVRWIGTSIGIATEYLIDMWWLGLALFLVCIIEVRPSSDLVILSVSTLLQRDGIDDQANSSWFNIFTIRAYILLCILVVALT